MVNTADKLYYIIVYIKTYNYLLVVMWIKNIQNNKKNSSNSMTVLSVLGQRLSSLTEKKIDDAICLCPHYSHLHFTMFF